MAERKTIIVVEDEPGQRVIYAVSLQREGYDVIPFDNAPEALAQIEQQPPHLIILDMMLPDVSGVEMLHEIRQHPASAGIPVVVVTAVRSITEERLAPYHVAGLLYKPILPHNLVEIVQGVIGS